MVLVPTGGGTKQMGEKRGVLTLRNSHEGEKRSSEPALQGGVLIEKEKRGTNHKNRQYSYKKATQKNLLSEEYWEKKKPIS